MTYEEFIKRYSFDTQTDQLGEGGFGEVFKAYDNYLDKWVAIKQSKVKKGLENFTLQKEVELAKKLPVHPNIAHYEDCHRFHIPMAGTYDFGILQYYPEGNLSKLRKAGKINEQNLNGILTGILNGLAHLHKHKIIHRDIKPGNILIVKRGNEYIPKITDFGISKQGTNTQASAVSNSLAGGTYSYAAPEQLKGESKIHPNADLWSFGVILYELLTNKLPFEATESDKSSEAARNEVTGLILSGKLPDNISTLPITYRRIITLCLTLDPSGRINRIEDLTNLVRKAIIPTKTVELNIPINTFEKTTLDKPKVKIPNRKPHTYQQKNVPKSFDEYIADNTFEMIFIEGGTFLMGDPNYEDSKPVHKVELNSFYLSPLLVTQKLWQAIMGNNPSYFIKGALVKKRILQKNIFIEEDTSEYPADSVSWYETQKFLKKLSEKTGSQYRLPTEAEWEFASKGGLLSSRIYKIYSGNDTIYNVAWYKKNSLGKSRAVGLKAANELGLYDMSGNVWEWCQDYYDSNYYKNCPIKNPAGAAKGIHRVIRGGSWKSEKESCSTGKRGLYSPDYKNESIGFRLALSLEE